MVTWDSFYITFVYLIHKIKKIIKLDVHFWMWEKSFKGFQKMLMHVLSFAYTCYRAAATLQPVSMDAGSKVISIDASKVKKQLIVVNHGRSLVWKYIVRDNACAAFVWNWSLTASGSLSLRLNFTTVIYSTAHSMKDTPKLVFLLQ